MSILKYENKVIILEVPSFVREFGDDNFSELPSKHTYKGSFSRHRAVEKVLLFFKRVNEFIGDDTWLYPFSSTAIAFLLGLNCGFPFPDVVLYCRWMRRRKSQIPKIRVVAFSRGISQ